MDTQTRTRIRRTALMLGLVGAAAALGTPTVAGAPAVAPAASAVTSAPPVAFHGTDAVDEAAFTWALERFDAGGLADVPSLEVHLHRSRETCGGGMGLYHAGRIDLCTKDSSEPYARKYALHEIAHAWVEANVDPAVLDSFMEQRGVAGWSDRSLPWKERGIEQVAEIVTWGLGEGEIVPRLPEPEEPDELARLFVLLTGRQPITPAA